MRKLIHDFSLILIGLLIGLLFYVKGCERVGSSLIEREPLQAKYDSLNDVIVVNQLHIKTLLHELTILDSTKQKVITKYITIRKQVLLTPCDSLIIPFVALADEVMDIDSATIHTLHLVVARQDTIINNQNSMLAIDSTIINSYKVNLDLANKEVKKQKRLKWVAIGLAGLVGVVAVVK